MHSDAAYQVADDPQAPCMRTMCYLFNALYAQWRCVLCISMVYTATMGPIQYTEMLKTLLYHMFASALVTEITHTCISHVHLHTLCQGPILSSHGRSFSHRPPRLPRA